MWKYQSNISLNRYAQRFINLNKNDKLRYLQILNYQNHYLFNFYLNLYKLSEQNNNYNNTKQQSYQNQIDRNYSKNQQSNLYSMKDRIQMLRNKLYKEKTHQPIRQSDQDNQINNYNNEVLERYRNKRKKQEREIIEERKKIIDIQKDKERPYKTIITQNKIEKKTEVKIPNQIKRNESNSQNQLVQYQDIKMLENLVSNKRVIVVGPAAYLNNLNNGEFIDNFDVVVRINKG